MTDTLVHAVTGTIARIELVNVNMARGRYTYNTHIFVTVDRMDPSHEFSEGPLKVRLPFKPRWKAMDPTVRRSLSVDGAKQSFSPSSFREYTVGDAVELRVRFTSPDLAHLVRQVGPAMDSLPT
jgi:hypothetical protein